PHALRLPPFPTRRSSDLAAFGYEAMRVVLASLRRAGRRANDRRRVIDEVFGLRRSDSIVGPYSIGPEGDATLRSFGAYRVSRDRDRKSTRLNSSHLVISY